MAASNAFAFGTFTVYEGRNSFSLQQASIREYFTGLAALQPGVYYAFYFMELADYYGREESDETQMLNLLYVSLKALLKERIPPRLIRRIFELKAMVLNGEYPDMFACAVCGKTEHLKVFSWLTVRRGKKADRSCRKLRSIPAGILLRHPLKSCILLL